VRGPEDEVLLKTYTFYVYRFLDVADADHGDGFMDFAKTDVDLSGTTDRRRKLAYDTFPGGDEGLALSDSSPGNFDINTNNEVIFRPRVVQPGLEATLQI